MTPGSGLRIAILTIGASGHIFPTLDLAEELLGRGHRVVYLAPESGAEAIGELGADHIRYNSTLAVNNSGAISPEEFAAWLPFVLMAEADHTLPVLTRCLDTVGPDILVYDRTTYLAATILAERMTLPSVCFFPSFAYNYDFDLIGDLERRTVFNPNHEAHHKLRDGLAELAQRWNSTPMPSMDLARAQTQCALVAIPREFQPRAESFDEGYVFTGPALSHRLADRTLTPSDYNGGILAALGTAFTDRLEVYKSIAESLRCMGHPGTIVAPEHMHADIEAASSLRIEEWIDQLEALSHAELFITHGGMGSVQEAAAYGVPMVCIPTSTEQRAVAERVAELGLGITLGSHPSTGEIAGAIDRALTDADLRYRCNDWAQGHHYGEAGAIGADFLERIAAQGR